MRSLNEHIILLYEGSEDNTLLLQEFEKVFDKNGRKDNEIKLAKELIEKGGAREVDDYGHKIFLITLSNGDLVYVDKNGIQHRQSGPAVIKNNGTVYWKRNGKKDRVDGPAIYNKNKEHLGSWYINDEYHREDGPARWFNNSPMWYINGVELEQRDFLYWVGIIGNKSFQGYMTKSIAEYIEYYKDKGEFSDNAKLIDVTRGVYNIQNERRERWRSYMSKLPKRTGDLGKSNPWRGFRK